MSESRVPMKPVTAWAVVNQEGELDMAHQLDIFALKTLALQCVAAWEIPGERVQKVLITPVEETT